MKKVFQKSILPLVVASAMIGCGGSSSTDEPDPYADTMAMFSLGLSDAPVDEADAVFIELESISLIPSEGEATVIEKFTNEQGQQVETVKVNLLDFQGSSQLKIIDEAQNITLENGTYQMELKVVDAGSYVLLDGDTTQHAIKVPSSRLRLGDFAVSDKAVQIDEQPAYTVEFDLRKSLVQRGNAKNNKGYIIKPHGVKVVSLAGGIEGSVASDFTNIGACSVYLYSDSVTEFGDMYDPTDEDYVTPEPVPTASSPLATTLVDADGKFAIGFVQPGSYQVALTCGNEADDNIKFDELTIPSVADITPDVQAITVTSQQTTTVTFEAP